MALFASQGAESCHALFEGRGWNRIFGVERPGARIWPWGERKQVQVAEGQRSNECHCLFEFGVGLAWEASHHVGAQCQRWSGCVYESLDLFLVVPGTVAAMHAAE